MLSPAWQPTTEQELSAAAANGLLGETHHMDMKRELEAGRGANRELARDLASFSVDGGLLILGVDEDSTPPSLYPIPLAGLAERVDQVALTVVDEPLGVRSTAIPSAADPSLGYLIVTIPPSPLAPHMVDGRYYGRGDKTKYVLSDDEVLRLHQRRQRWEKAASDLLDAYVRRDPTTAQAQAHLFIVAEPLAAPNELLLPLIEGEGSWQKRLLDLVHTRALGNVPVGQTFAPDLNYATATFRRADGWALASHEFHEGRPLDSDVDETNLIEVEISEGGAIRLFCGRGTETIQSGQRVLFEQLIVGLCHRVLAIAKTIAEDAGHWASWDLGVAVTEVRGSVSWLRAQSMSTSVSVFPDDDYRATTRASYEDLASRPNAVVDRLLGRLVRALGTGAFEPMRALLD